MEELEKIKIQVDLLKIWTTTNMAIIAGEVAVMNTFFETSSYLFLLQISLGLFALAVVFALGDLRPFRII